MLCGVFINVAFISSQVNMFAPNIEQMHVVDHLKGAPSQEKRNVLVESARLARGNIQDLSKLSVKDHDAIIFPGLKTQSACVRTCFTDSVETGVRVSLHGNINRTSSLLLLLFFWCFAGGFGAAKNLCTWAVQGKDCSVNDEVRAALQAFHSEGKPIGLCCISPVLAAKVFPGCEVTVGIEQDDK